MTKLLCLALLLLASACAAGPKPLPMPHGEVFRLNPERWGTVNDLRQPPPRVAVR